MSRSASNQVDLVARLDARSLVQREVAVAHRRLEDLRMLDDAIEGVGLFSARMGRGPDKLTIGEMSILVDVGPTHAALFAEWYDDKDSLSILLQISWGRVRITTGPIHPRFEEWNYADLITRQIPFK